MKKFASIILSAGIALIAAAPAQAFTKWSTFEYQGYTVNARYQGGALRYIHAVNAQTGEEFRGHVAASGVAILKVDGETVRISLDDAERRVKNRMEIRDLAQVQ
ncbi:MAG: hypothetical protein AAF337_09525 [Pseudomonadota bacterium]